MKNPGRTIILYYLFSFVLLIGTVLAQEDQKNEIQPVKLDNPITVAYLKNHLSRNSPKLILTPEIERILKKKLKIDSYTQHYYSYLKDESNQILKEPLLKRELEGFRLLAVSRRMVERMGILSMVYRLDKNPEILARINEELLAVCAFMDWNPQHFLDVAEMSFGVALAIDWVGAWLPKETIKLAKTSLIEKGIIPSFNEGGTRMFWINSSNNWNAVCHGGMITAALVIADVNPELAAKTISRALEKLPNSLKEYAPDGVYPEGPTYWGYGTSYSVIASNALTTAMGKDFGIAESPGFMEGPDFVLHTTAPSGELFNFADCGDNSFGRFSILMSWFAGKTGDGLYFDRDFFEKPQNAGRLAGLGLVWLAQFNQKKISELPLAWHGNGENPIAVFRGEKDNPNHFYLGVKGGKANLSHGNMDAGTFVFELDGVRWVIDPGNQAYYPLNKIGFNLAGHCQECPRWTLLTKKNQGHSTITVNDERFMVDGHATIDDFKEGEKPEVTIDLSEVYGENVNSLHRRLVKESDRSILIEDKVQTNEATKFLTWGLMTTADVHPEKNGATLKKEGKTLHLTILTPGNLQVSVISLDPPPMKIDKTIENLKRIEIRVPAYLFKDGNGIISVRLSRQE